MAGIGSTALETLPWLLLFQGGLTLAQVLSVLRQAVAALLHLHSLGILHRDLRAANLHIDSLDPLHVFLSDFGLSHLLPEFAVGTRPVDLTASMVPSVLTGTAALFALQVRHPRRTMLGCRCIVSRSTLALPQHDVALHIQVSHCSIA